MLSIGTRLCPPARTLAPSPWRARQSTASSTDAGAAYSNGAGFDPVDVDACTAAGVLVVNQSGGNANSVAEHALGMLLTLSKRILESAKERHTTSTRAAEELADRLMQEPHPLFPGRGSAIISSLVAAKWHQERS